MGHERQRIPAQFVQLAANGVSSAVLSAVFDLFVQEPLARARHNGGLGIGLTVVRQLVEAHGGTVTAHSDGKDLDSEFVVRLPIEE